MRNNKRFILMSVLILLGGFLFINLINAEMLTSSANVSYDSELLKAFNDKIYATNLINQPHFIGLQIINNETLARVDVVLKDGSGVNITGTKEERIRLIHQKNAWIGNETDTILKDYSAKDLILGGKSSSGFSAFVTEGVLNRLINDSRIDRINWIYDKPKLTGINDYTILRLPWLLFFGIIFLVLLIILVIIIHVKRKRKNAK